MPKSCLSDAAAAHSAVAPWPEMSDELLAIVPPYAMDCPPAGIAMLNGYLEQHGRAPMDVLDLRLWAPAAYSPTFRAIGRQTESYVMDIPDLPLVLELVQAFADGSPLSPRPGAWFPRFCADRAISETALGRWLSEIDTYLRTQTDRLRCSFMGFSVWTSNYYSTLLAAAYLKRQPDPPLVVLGGPQVTESRNAAALALKSGIADVIVPGEGEQAFLHLVDAFRDGRAAEETPGTLRWRDGELKQTPRALLAIKELPIPSLHRMPLMAYQGPHRPEVVVPFQLSRGCTDKCTFCSEWVFWERLRLAPVEHALDQVEELIDRFGATRLRMVDSLLNGSVRRLREFAEGILNRGIEIRWSGFMRANANDEVAALLRRSGFDHAFVGVESLDDATLADMNKRRTGQQNRDAVMALLRRGISVRAGVIPGYPGDSIAGFEHTVRGLLEIKREYPRSFSAGMEPFIVSPGAPLFRDLASRGLWTRPWDEEILALAPDFEEISAQSQCTVHGNNQGATRQQMVEALRPLGEGVTDFWPVERIGSLTTQFLKVPGGLWLARRKAPRWGLEAWLLRSSERVALEVAEQRGCGESRAERRDLLASVERDHVVRTGAEDPPHSHRHHKAVAASSVVRLGPTIVARRVAGAMVILDYRTLVAARLPASAIAMLEDLARGPRPVSALERGGMRDTEVEELIDGLNRRGFVFLAQ